MFIPKPDGASSRKKPKSQVKKHVPINYVLFSEELKNIDTVSELRNFRGSTKDHFLHCINEACQWLYDSKGKKICDATVADMREFLLYLKKYRKPNTLSPSSINIYNAAIRNYFKFALGRPMDNTDLPYMKVDTDLPDVPSVQEVLKFLSTTEDYKDFAMFSTSYGCALRLDETACVRCGDVSLTRMQLTVPANGSKNRSTGYVEIPNTLAEVLKTYIRECYPGAKEGDYLFPGQKEGDHISKATIDAHFKKHMKELGWQDRGYSYHNFFRHGHALHYYQSGADLFQVQLRLRHKSITSTLIYIALDAVHRARADGGNPLDRILGGKQEGGRNPLDCILANIKNKVMK